MLRLFCCFLVALFFSVQCLQRQILYSRLDKEVTNFSLTVLHGEIASLIHCAELCSRDDYCMEFVFSKTSRPCIGLHCLKTDNYAYQYVSPTPYRGLYFGKVSNWVEYSGHHYFYVEENFTWAEAKLECQKMCAYLVEVETKEESEWLAATFIMKDSCSSFALRICSAWTGGNDIDTDGQFVWDHSNTTIGFYNWSPNNPTKIYLNIQDCIDIYRNGEWNDRHCSHFNHSFVKKIS